MAYALLCIACDYAFPSARPEQRSLPAPQSRSIRARCPECRKSTECFVIPPNWAVSRYVLGQGLTREDLNRLHALAESAGTTVEVGALELLTLVRMARKTLGHGCSHGKVD